MSLAHKIGFLGTGRMATALAKGLVASETIAAGNIFGTDVSEPARQQFSRDTGGATLDSIAEVCRCADVIMVAVKPQHVSEVLTSAKAEVTDGHLIVSIAAGVPLAKLSDGLGAQRRIIRVMPNTPCLVGAGASAFARGGAATREDAELVQSLLSTVGTAVEVPETLLDAVTGLSGSGPAYGYLMIEALSDGGVRAGLPRQIATQLAAQTLLGAACMVLETGEHPGALKDAVASPAGTTIAGLHALETGGLRGCLMDAVLAATQRSRELGRG